ncbi:MAG: HAD hydrolase family protein [Candidatus Woesearchaeota archaeon]
MLPLLDIVRPDLKALGKEIRTFIGYADSFEAEIINAFPKSGIKRMKDNNHMLTYEFDGDVITAKDVYSFLEPKIPDAVKQGISEGNVKVVTCSFAIDIRSDVDKGHAIDHILKKLGRTGEGGLGIGDSYHSDIDMMERCEYVACPANSNEALKDYVSDRKGYIAKEPFGKGVIEIYSSLI